jgi:hypothetical protein
VAVTFCVQASKTPADEWYKIGVMPESGVMLYIGSAQDVEKLSKMTK